MVNVTLFSAVAIMVLLILYNSIPKKEGDKHGSNRTQARNEH